MLNYQKVFIKMFNYLAKTYNRFVSKMVDIPENAIAHETFWGSTF